MSLRQKAKGLIITARDVIFPEASIRPEEVAARSRADALWAELFAPLQPMVDDADILEIGCYDGRLLLRRLEGSASERPARSGIGLDRTAFWRGMDDAIGLPPSADEERIELHDSLSYLQALDPASFDLAICRSFEAVFPVGDAEAALHRLYDLLRPGGELLVRIQCADIAQPSIDGPGYGFMTPSSWIMLVMRAGFEVGGIRRVSRDSSAAHGAAAVLPLASDDERMTAEIRCRLIRPWETWELDRIWSA